MDLSIWFTPSLPSPLEGEGEGEGRWSKVNGM